MKEKNKRLARAVLFFANRATQQFWKALCINHLKKIFRPFL